MKKKAPCNDCIHAQDPRPRKVRWYLPQKIKEVLNQLEDAGHDLSLFFYCSKKQSIESLVGERDCEEHEAKLMSERERRRDLWEWERQKSSPMRDDPEPKFVLECVICRWRTNWFRIDPDVEGGIPRSVRAYLARHIRAQHREYRRFTDSELWEKGHKVRVLDDEV